MLRFKLMEAVALIEAVILWAILGLKLANFLFARVPANNAGGAR